MRKLTVTILVFLLGAAAARAGEIHAILVSDPNNIMSEHVQDISVGVRVNVAKMKTLLGQIARKGAVTVKTTEVTGDDFSCANINRAVAELSVQPDDTVLFYYAGHGFRSAATQGKFPEFFCDEAVFANGQSAARLSQIVADIKRKGPRLTIAIADTCNKDDVLPPAIVPQGAGRPPKKQAIKRLFLDYRGTITVSGAIPGQSSWYRVTGLDIGGLFTQQFLTALNTALGSDAPLPTWAKVLDAATKRIEIQPRPPATEVKVQQPQFESSAVLIP